MEQQSVQEMCNELILMLVKIQWFLITLTIVSFWTSFGSAVFGDGSPFSLAVSSHQVTGRRQALTSAMQAAFFSNIYMKLLGKVIQ